MNSVSSVDRKHNTLHLSNGERRADDRKGRSNNVFPYLTISWTLSSAPVGQKAGKPLVQQETERCTRRDLDQQVASLHQLFSKRVTDLFLALRLVRIINLSNHCGKILRI